MSENSFKANGEVLELRGHHLGVLQDIHEVTRKEFFRRLSEDPCAEGGVPRKSWVPYVTSPEDPFMKVGYDDLRQVLANPTRVVRLTSDKPDFICEVCPFKRKPNCPDNRPTGYAAFGIPNSSIDDSTIASRFGLEVEVNYTTQEIIRALGLEAHYPLS